MMEPTKSEDKKPGLNIKISLDNEDKVELLDNLEIAEDFKKKVLYPYLKHLFEDLASRDNMCGKGISKAVFLDFVNMPGMVGERVFHLYDANKDEIVDLIEFLSVSGKFFQSSFDAKLRLVFDLFDGNRDGFVSAEDIRSTLSHIPLELITSCRSTSKIKGIEIPSPDASMEVYLDRVHSLEELAQLISLCLKKRPVITFEEFKDVTMNICSDMFLCVYLYLRSHMPLYDQVYYYANRVKKVPSINSPKQAQLISSPKMLSRFSPLALMVQKSNSCRKLVKEEVKKRALGGTPKRSTFKRELADFSSFSEVPNHCEDRVDLEDREEDFTSAINETTEEDSGTPSVNKIPTLKINSNDLCWIKERTSSKDLFIDAPGEAIRLKHQYKPSTFQLIHTPLAEPEEEQKETVSPLTDQCSLYCECGSLCEPNESLCKACLEKQRLLEFSGFLYVSSKEVKKKYWLRLVNKEIYCYKSKSDEDCIKLFELSGVFVKKEPIQEIIADVKCFSFSLNYYKDKKMFYAVTEWERDEWISTIQTAIGYSNLYSFYEIRGLLGKGTFAEVRSGEHKITGQKVAVKILRKKQMTEKQISRARSEIETLKMCQHPNIMRLYEVFENADYIYLVLEYLSGGNLNTFIHEKKEKIAERETSKIILAVAQALDYIHTFGIVHRDIKSDNIVLSDVVEGSEAKIVDFGLAVILGPEEKSREAVGTLCFAAPEILSGMSYDKQVDMWSLGVMAYQMLSGGLPYRPDMVEKAIARMIVNSDPKYEEPMWAKRSNEAMDFMKKILTRDPRFRMTFKELTQHPWITLNNLGKISSLKL